MSENQQEVANKDYAFVDQMRECDRCQYNFRFWNGMSFGLCVAEVVSAGRPVLWYVLGMWACATIISWVWYRRGRKAVAKLGTLV